MNNTTAIATLGGGCFWCVEAVFQELAGVQEVVSGYSGGTKDTADYRSVCSGLTQHAEVVQVHFDPSVLTYEEVLEIFFTTHDPTTPNQQGNDKGPQYRSIIFYHDEEQRDIAERVKGDFATKLYEAPIVTEIEALEAFYPAETYHQDYYDKTGDRNPYCTYVVTPKVQKVRKLYREKLKA